MNQQAPHLTAVEHAWNDLPIGHRVGLKRVDRYDFETGLYYSPGIYDHLPLAPKVVTGSPTVLLKLLDQLVHPGVSDSDMPTKCPKIELPDRRNTISEEVLHQLLRNTESRLVYGGALEELVASYRDDRALQILGLLSHPLLGNRRNREFLSHEALSDLVSRCLRERLPFQLVLPAFPFKDQNPFRTSSPASHWDIGEASLLIRLHCLALGLNQLHSYDGECLIVSDGRAYAQTFGIRESEAIEYLQGLRELRNSLNLQRTVHFIDLRSIMEKVDRTFVLSWEGRRIVGLKNISVHVEGQLESLARSSDLAANKLAALGGSMAWNIGTRDYLIRINAPTLWRAMNPKRSRLDSLATEVRRELEDRSWRVGLKYAAFSITLTLSQFWSIMFPTSIRATVHAKAGQALIPKLGRGDPWNAVGVVDDGQLGPDSIRTLPLWKIAQSEYQPVFLAGGRSPLAMVRRGLVSDLANR